MPAEEILIFGLRVELLAEQFAASSGRGVEVDEDVLVFRLRFGKGFLEGASEPFLAPTDGRKEKKG
jgi:hypothetical protein